MPCHTLWTEKLGCAILQTSDVKELFQRNFTFSPLWQKVWSISKVETDKFALFSVVWKKFTDNSISCCTPGAFITVVNSFLPGHCVLTFINAVYGVKAWHTQAEILASCWQKVHVCGKWSPYADRDETRCRDECVSDQVVMLLSKSYLNKGRKITTDNCFTLMKLQKMQKNNKIDCLKVKSKMLFSAPFTQASPLPMIPTIYQKGSNLIMTQNMVLILSVKWHSNTRLDLSPDDLCIRFIIHCGYESMDHLQGGHREQHTQNSFLPQLVDELSGPHIDERKNTETRGCKKKHLMKGKMRTFCQVKSEWKKNRTMDTCHECCRPLSGKCTGKTRLCVKWSSSQPQVSFLAFWDRSMQ